MAGSGAGIGVRACPVAIILLSAVVGCGPARQTAAVRPPAPRHVVFVTIDTLRADRVGIYGRRDAATPNLDRLAREGALVPQTTAQAPLTRPSHTTIFTGRYPAAHGVRDNVSAALSPDIPTLAEQFEKHGFQTAAFISSIVLSSQSGLSRGFQTYSETFADDTPDDARFLNTIQRRGDIPTGEAIEWLRAHAAAPTFLWLHLYDPHDPYEPPEPFASRFADRPYDGEVAWSDELVGRVDRALDAAGIRDETLMVVTSDHGEGLGDHGEAVHGFFIYETTLRVPFIARGPGIPAGTTLEATLRHVDLFPTLLDLAGVPAPGSAGSGRSVADALRGGKMIGDEPSFAESLTPLVHYGWSDLRSVRDGRWKYILAPRPELYDLTRDPDEQHNLESAEPARARALRAGLEANLRQESALSRTSTTPASIPPELLEKLGALGYVSGTAPAASRATGADPKDKIEEYKTLNRLMREGLVHLRTREYAASAERFQGLVARGVDSFEVHYYFGRVLAGQRKWADAAAHFERAIERLPVYGQAYLGLADSRLALGDGAGAIAALQKGQAKSPRDVELIEREAEIWRRLEHPERAIAAYERELPMLPKDALVRVRLGELYRTAGDPTRSIAMLKEAVRLDPNTASYWNALGMVLGGNNDPAGAEAAFREAVARNAGDAQYAYNLGLVLERRGSRTEALDWYRKALALNPRFAAPRDRLADAARSR
jgi:choline-sulfatase